MLFGCNLDVSRWGAHILRIRLELDTAYWHINKEFSLSEWHLPCLRILIIGRRPHDTDDLGKSSTLMENILRNATQELRYVSICSVAYWIDHGQSQEESEPSQNTKQFSMTDYREHPDRSKWRAIPWRTATGGEDERIRSQVFSWLGSADRDFIDDGSYLNQERQDWQNEDEGGPTPYALHMENFLVARRC